MYASNKPITTTNKIVHCKFDSKDDSSLFEIIKLLIPQCVNQ